MLLTGQRTRDQSGRGGVVRRAETRTLKPPIFRWTKKLSPEKGLDDDSVFLWTQQSALRGSGITHASRLQ